MTTTQQHVAANVRARMARSGLSQKSLGATLGLKQQSVSHRLTSRTSFTLDEVFVIADVFGVPVSELFPTAQIGVTR